MRAIEDRRGVAAARRRWERAFANGAVRLESRYDAYWHEDLGIWGVFSETVHADGRPRDWNAFGQVPANLRQNIVVEINPPREGRSAALQGAFAVDGEGRRWVLHRGRMNVPNGQVTPATFSSATGLQPVEVRFSDGSMALFHPVADLDDEPVRVQAEMAKWVSACALARLAAEAPADVLAAVRRIEDWERRLNPERTGSYEAGAREAVVARRLHAEVWRALVAELKRRDLRLSNDRVGRYGPDLFTVGRLKVLFEIKSRASSADLFEGLGQLQVYERLLGLGYRKVVVVPRGLAVALSDILPQIGVDLLTYVRRGRSITFDPDQLAACLRPERMP